MRSRYRMDPESLVLGAPGGHGMQSRALAVTALGCAQALGGRTW